MECTQTAYFLYLHGSIYLNYRPIFVQKKVIKALNNEHFDNFYIMKHLLFISLFFLVSCTSSSEKAAWKVAEQSKTNSEELTRFLEYYRTSIDQEKYKAACFLVKNMPNKYSIDENDQKKISDVDIVIADSLILSLEYSFNLKKHSPFLKKYTFEQFCEYILPYRIANEPLQYYWKWDCIKRFGNGNNEDMLKAAHDINTRIRIEMSPEFYEEPLKSYSTIIRTGYGKCDDRAILLAMALRSAGIPSAFEYIPYWGSSNNGHSFASVIQPNDSIVIFQNNNKNGSNNSIYRKAPKIYRKVYSITPKIRYCGNRTEYPEIFSDCDIIDVTNKHQVGYRNVQVGNIKGEPIYLSVFSPNGWIPVDVSLDGNFQHIGTGVNNTDYKTNEAIDLGNGILYLPSEYTNGEMNPISYPIAVSDDSIRRLQIDTIHKEMVILERKYPLNERVVGFARNMLDGIFEGANQPDFSDAQELYHISAPPLNRKQKIRVDSDKSYRYIRYIRFNHKKFSIAELNVYNTDGTPIFFRPIACKALANGEDLRKVFDSDPLTYFEVDGVIELWVGMDLGKKQVRVILLE